MNAVAKGLAQAAGKSPNSRALASWARLAAGWSFDAFYDDEHRQQFLSYLTIDTTGACDLTCRDMCYYNPRLSKASSGVGLQLLERAVRESQEQLGLRNLIFAGKEPLLNAALAFDLMAVSGNLPNRTFSIGFVTNGRHVEAHWERLADVAARGCLNFLDISLDSGFAEEHDRIRGVRGTFDLAWSALQRSAAHLTGVRVGVTSVIRHDNHAGLIELVRRAARVTPHIFMTPIQPPAFLSTPPLPWSVISRLFAELVHLLSGELKNAGVEVVVSLLGLYLHDAAQDGLIDWSLFQEDAQGQCFVERVVASNRLVIHAQVLPESGWRLARVTASGAYLSNSHFLQDARPDRFAVGFVQSESMFELYRRATAEGSLLHRIVRSRQNHNCVGRPCWHSCFGGFAAAEHSLIEGVSIERQPRLCLKTLRPGEGRTDSEVTS